VLAQVPAVLGQLPLEELHLVGADLRTQTYTGSYCAMREGQFTSFNRCFAKGAIIPSTLRYVLLNVISTLLCSIDSQSVAKGAVITLTLVRAIVHDIDITFSFPVVLRAQSSRRFCGGFLIIDINITLS
jgi:hypothetical protein